MRGNHFALITRLSRQGPIPACAGQPISSHRNHPASRAYPRVCGATGAPFSLIRYSPGLSPRVRGNRRHAHVICHFLGPIPACAGQPGRLRHISPRIWAYPRVCGATSLTLNATASSEGLSPRVRGNPYGVQTLSMTPGPIPACAGQPRAHHAPLSVYWAYPRVCGATGFRSAQGVVHVGLSPRVRGNPHPFAKGDVWTGPIPACAGQPRLLRSALAWSRAYPRVCGATSCT